MYNKPLSDRSYKNKRNVREVEEAVKCEFRRWEVEPMNKIAGDLEDSARWHNSEILSCHAKYLRRNSESGLVPVKDRSGGGGRIDYKEKV